MYSNDKQTAYYFELVGGSGSFMAENDVQAIEKAKFRYKDEDG